MSEAKPEQYVFPFQFQGVGECFGMTLREYFAGKAMEGLLAADNYYHGDVPHLAYQIADQMIAESRAAIAAAETEGA